MITDEMVEAVAQALHAFHVELHRSSNGARRLPLWADELPEARELRRAEARAALTAAAPLIRAQCAEVLRPKEPRPCDCDRCVCGNVGDAEAVTSWDAANASADAILALNETETTP